METEANLNDYDEHKGAEAEPSTEPKGSKNIQFPNYFIMCFMVIGGRTN
jgi:hypothetical protein